MGTTIVTKFFFLIFLFYTSFSFSSVFHIIPPKKWRLADPKALTHANVGFVSNQKKAFVSSLNVSQESISISKEKYIEEVKKLYRLKKENHITDMGGIKTKCGEAKLLQIEVTKSWGMLIILQSILIKENSAYIMTGVALKEDFPYCSKDFLDAFSSFNVTQTPYDLIADSQKKNALLQKDLELKQQFALLLKKGQDPEALFHAKEFQKKRWKPYERFINKQFVDLGVYFPSLMLSWTQKELFAIIAN